MILPCFLALNVENGAIATKGKIMTQLLMPKATAVWLIDNSALTFEQIGLFCNLHPLEVQSIADGEAGMGIQGYDPIINGQITRAELDRCEAAASHLSSSARVICPFIIGS